MSSIPSFNSRTIKDSLPTSHWESPLHNLEIGVAVAEREKITSANPIQSADEDKPEEEWMAEQHDDRLIPLMRDILSNLME